MVQIFQIVFDTNYTNFFFNSLNVVLRAKNSDLKMDLPAFRILHKSNLFIKNKFHRYFEYLENQMDQLGWVRYIVEWLNSAVHRENWVLVVLDLGWMIQKEPVKLCIAVCSILAVLLVWLGYPDPHLEIL